VQERPGRDAPEPTDIASKVIDQADQGGVPIRCAGRSRENQP